MHYDFYAQNKRVLQMLPKLSAAGDLSYSSSGKLFHTRGPATAKLLSPRVVRVRGTTSVL